MNKKEAHNYLILSNNYYPFGSVAKGRSFSSTAYRYGFNGQEKDNEVSGDGNSNTAEFWQYDTRLGRRWNLDPRPQIKISDYATFGNNPIKFSDILGDKFDEKSSKHVDAYEKKLGERKAEINKAMDNVIAEFDKAKVGADVSGLVNQYKELSRSKEEVTAAENELNEMKNSPQLFAVRDNYKGGGETKYDVKNNAVLIRFDGKFSSIGHELKHGSQFLAGDLSFDKKTGDAGQLADLNDEQRAYQRELALDPNTFNRPDVKYSDITIDKVKNQKEGNNYPYIEFSEKDLKQSNFKGDLSKDIIFTKPK